MFILHKRTSLLHIFNPKYKLLNQKFYNIGPWPFLDEWDRDIQRLTNIKLRPSFIWKTFFFVTDDEAKQARVFVSGKQFS